MSGRSLNAYVFPALLGAGSESARSGTSRNPAGPVAAWNVTGESYVNRDSGADHAWNAGSSERPRSVVAMVSIPPAWLSADGAEPTQRSPFATASPTGSPPTARVETTTERWASILETVPEYLLATQTRPSEEVIADGPLPTGTVAMTASV